MPARGVSREAEDLDPFPVSHPKRPPEDDDLVGTALALANLTGALPVERPYNISS